MKTSIIPAVLLIILCQAFVGLLAWSAHQLPDQVATHFGFTGHPDRWSSRASAVMMMGGFGLGLPLLMAVFAWVVRFMPDSTVNVPHREYWLAPERRAETYAFFTRQLLWLGCLLVCFMMGLTWVTVQANTRTPVQMPSASLFTLLGVFLAGMAVWSIRFVSRFRRPPGPKSGC